MSPATSESGKLITCGSTDDLGQSYVTSGKHCETPEPFPLPPEVCVQKAEAGLDHCVARAMKFIHGDGRNVYPQEECLDKWKEIRVK
ncbi:BnaAnng38960D [Brassica napus]|uniref:BnaAnng38960D protein n=2 Tax=Brassica napus TaxID=3708 RepID=A0A078K253_BRANA|nr:BnaAnng38960D [Brassica napus]